MGKQEKTTTTSKAGFRSQDRSTPSRVISRLMRQAQGDEPAPVIHLTEADIIIPLKGKGEGPPELINVRVPSLIARRLEVLIVSENGVTFETKSDLLRACIHIGVSILEGATIQGGVFKVAKLISSLAFTELENAKFGEVLDQLQTVVNAQLAVGASSTARRTVLKAKEAISQMNPEQQKIFGGKIDKMFSHILIAGRPSLHYEDMADEKEKGSEGWEEEEEVTWDEKEEEAEKVDVEPN